MDSSAGILSEYYYTVAKAIAYLQKNHRNQPDLEEIAKALNLSPFHFQRIFSEWAGVSPKKFLQFISLSNARSLLATNQASLFDTALESGLSGTGRLHDLFVTMEAMTPAEYKNGGKNLVIEYSYYSSIFGNILTASTGKGLCFLEFIENQESGFQALKRKFPQARYLNKQTEFHTIISSALNQLWDKPGSIKLHVKGTNFQIKVWEALLRIPEGRLSTYGQIAKELDAPNSSRAVGTAIGNNPIAYIIPCHRVLRSDGGLGGYHWREERKLAMIGREWACTGN